MGWHLPAGLDQGMAYHIPYNWWLTNTCIAAQVADPNLIEEVETGQNFVLEVVDPT